MPEVISFVMTVTFLAVWILIGCELVGRHAREARVSTTKRHAHVRPRTR